VLLSDGAAIQESIGKLFVDTYFPEVAEAAAQQMLGDIRIAFEDHLETLSWMDSDTRESAVEKLEGMDYQVGYPEGWPLLAKYGTLQLSEESFYQNIITVAQAHSQQERDRLFEEPMKEKWSHAATTTNAYYSRNKNALFIPAGILQPPFFLARLSGLPELWRHRLSARSRNDSRVRRLGPQV